MGKGRPLNKASLRISAYMCENFLAVTVVPFQNGLKPLAFSVQWII